VVCIVARSSLRTGYALCACDGMSVCLCVCSYIQRTSGVQDKKKGVGAGKISWQDSRRARNLKGRCASRTGAPAGRPRGT
jgi:hypothetical protein